MNLNIDERGVAEFLTGAGAGLLAGVTVTSAFIRPLGAVLLIIVYAASAAVAVAGVWVWYVTSPATWVPAHETAPAGRLRRVAVAVLAAVRVWPLLPGAIQGPLCGCLVCKGGGESS